MADYEGNMSHAESEGPILQESHEDNAEHGRQSALVEAILLRTDISGKDTKTIEGLLRWLEAQVAAAEAVPEGARLQITIDGYNRQLARMREVYGVALRESQAASNSGALASVRSLIKNIKNRF